MGTTVFSPTGLFIRDVNETGQPSPPTLLCVHGAETTQRTWDEVIERLKGIYRIVTFDLKGHGASHVDERVKFTEADFAPGPMAADIDTVMRVRCLGKVILVGHSLGGKIAVQFAHQFPDRVKALVLLDISMRPRETQHLAESDIVARRNFQTTYPSLQDLAKASSKLNPDLTEERMTHWLKDGRVTKVSNDFVVNIHPYVTYLARKMISESPFMDTTYKWLDPTIPILHLKAGSAASIVSYDALKEMRRLKPPSERVSYVTILDAEHSLHKSHLERFVEELNRFVQRVTK
jgi:pimeloyl-ACP methyl ester carboxylesterase